MPDPVLIQPNGLDRADGLAGREGTPDAAGAILYDGPGGITDILLMPVNEEPDSPEIERGEQATITHRFRMSWAEAKTRIHTFGRGTLLQDSEGNVTKILTAKIQHQQGDAATLVIVSESVSFDSPPDQFQVVPVELGINIIKHPRYFYAFLGNSPTDEALNQAVIRNLQNYFENINSQYRDDIIYRLFYSMSTNSGGHSVGGTLTGAGVAVPDATYRPSGMAVDVEPIPGTDWAKAAALEIVQKYWRNEETPYIIGYQIVWSAFYFRPQYLNPGGYVESPMSATPQLPEYFSSPNYPPDAVTIFDQMHQVNPQCYSMDGTTTGTTNISWMRKADEVDEQRTWFKVTRSWIGSVVGHWDPQLYTNANRPTGPADYEAISPSKQMTTPPPNFNSR